MPLSPAPSPLIRRLPETVLAVLFLLACALIDRRGFNPVEIDSHSYINAARGLLVTGSFALPPEDGSADGPPRPIYFRTPGLPVVLAPFLALFGDSGPRFFVWAQRLLWAVFVVFLLPPVRPSPSPCAALAARTGALLPRLIRLAPLTGKTLALFLPLVLTAVSAVLTEVLYTVLTWCGLLLLARLADRPGWRAAAGAGLLLAAATMVRPIGAWLPIVVASTLLAVQFFRRRPLPAASLALATTLALASPLLWSARNLAASGHFFFCTIDGPTLALHRADAIRALPPSVTATFPPEQQAFVEEVRQHGDVFWAQLQIQKRHGLDEYASSRAAYAVARVATFQFPGHYVRTVIRNLANIFLAPADTLALTALLSGNGRLTTLSFGDAVRSGAWGIAALHLATRVAHLVLLLVIPALLVIRSWPKVRRDPTFWVLGASSACLILGPVALTVTYGRFLFPVLPAVVWCYCLPGRECVPRTEE